MSPDVLIFFTILVTGLILSSLFNRLHLPWVVALMLAGVVLGPEGLGFFAINETFELLAEIGLIFLMFMAGLETKFSSMENFKDSILWLSILNSFIPFVAGISIGLYFEYAILTSVLLGIVLASSSVAVIFPLLERNGLLSTRLGKSIVSSAIIEDVFGLALLSILLQTLDPTTNIPLPLLYVFLFTFLIILKISLPKIRYKFSFLRTKKRDMFEHELRLIFVILLGVVVVFELIGLHAVIAGFFAGFSLSDSIKSEDIKHKLHALSYGIFIPVFFITVGSKAGISTLTSGNTLLITGVLIGASLFTKFISGFLAAQMSEFSIRNSIFIGTAMTPQLSTPLAIAQIGAVTLVAGQPLLDTTLVTAIISLTIVTTFLGPISVNYLSKNINKKIS